MAPSRRRSRLRIAALVVVVLALAKVAWVADARTDPRALLDGRANADLVLRRDALTSRLIQSNGPSGFAPADPQFQGEWHLVSLSMTAAAVTSMAFDAPETRGEATELVGALAAQTLAEPARRFDRDRWGEDPLDALDAPDPSRGHAGYLGHLGIVLGALRLLDVHTHDALHDRLAAAIARRLDASASVSIATYPGETYTADVAVTVAALALHADATGAPRPTAIARWVEHTRAHLLDPDTGLIVASVDAAGHPEGTGRGSWAGWSSFYLPMIDGALAADQYQRMKEHLFVRLPFGAAAVREHPRHRPGIGDVDSGPLVFGLSPAATGFAVAGARHAGDADLLGGFLLTAEVVGSSVTWGDRRSYLLAPLVGDAILLAMKTARPWDRRFVDR